MAGYQQILQWLIFLWAVFLHAFPCHADERVAHRIMVYKSEYRMELLDKENKLITSYKIALGGNPKGHKVQEGDERTPEGIYTINGRNPDSRFHLSLRISYPNKQDELRARESGVSPGGDIMIHGLPNGFGWIGTNHLIKQDWTDGCIAVTNDEIEEIWKLVPDGTEIEIRP